MESLSVLWWWEHAYQFGSHVDSTHILVGADGTVQDTAFSGVKGDGAKRIIAEHSHSWFGADHTAGYHDLYAHGARWEIYTSNAGCFGGDEDPPPPPMVRHEVNGIYHNIYWEDAENPDRHHAWTAHDHGRMYAAVWFCGGDPTCDDPYRHTFGCENYSASGGHVDCNARGDDYAFGYAVTYWDGGPSPCQEEMEAPWPQYADDHGICWHMMREVDRSIQYGE